MDRSFERGLSAVNPTPSGTTMIPPKQMTLKGLDEWMQQKPGSFTGDADADTACLVFYSHEDHTLCTAEIQLEKGTVDWTHS